jgi:hypothetical protein
MVLTWWSFSVINLFPIILSFSNCCEMRDFWFFLWILVVIKYDRFGWNCRVLDNWKLFLLIVPLPIVFFLLFVGNIEYLYWTGSISERILLSLSMMIKKIWYKLSQIYFNKCIEECLLYDLWLPNLFGTYFIKYEQYDLVDLDPDCFMLVWIKSNHFGA